jgi:hypothetical protein
MSNEAFDKEWEKFEDSDEYRDDSFHWDEAALLFYKAGQNQRDEEVTDLKRKLFLEGVKNNSDRARTEFLEDKLTLSGG